MSEANKVPTVNMVKPVKRVRRERLESISTTPLEIPVTLEKTVRTDPRASRANQVAMDAVSRRWTPSSLRTLSVSLFYRHMPSRVFHKLFHNVFFL